MRSDALTEHSQIKTLGFPVRVENYLIRSGFVNCLDASSYILSLSESVPYISDYSINKAKEIAATFMAAMGTEPLSQVELRQKTKEADEIDAANDPTISPERIQELLAGLSE